MNVFIREILPIFKSKFKKSFDKEETTIQLYLKILQLMNIENESDFHDSLTHIFVHFASDFFERSIKLECFPIYKLIIDTLPSFHFDLIILKKSVFVEILQQNNLASLM